MAAGRMLMRNGHACAHLQEAGSSGQGTRTSFPPVSALDALPLGGRRACRDRGPERRTRANRSGTVPIMPKSMNASSPQSAGIASAAAYTVPGGALERTAGTGAFLT